MNVHTQNKAKTVGIVSHVENVKNIGEFNLAYLEEWIKQIRLVLGDERDIYLQLKKGENPSKPAYVLLASHDGGDPKVAVAGKHLDDGKEW